MTKHFRKELDLLKRKLLALSSLVEDRLKMAVSALENRNQDEAHIVIDRDAEIDDMEVALEEECLKVLALYQPVAGDLRFVVAVLKINNDLERIGDLAVNIAERALFLASRPPASTPLDFQGMADKAREMLRAGLQSLVEGDVALAWKVMADDDEVDAMNRRMYDLVQTALQEHPDEIPRLIHLLSTSRHLERIADHATNIAEDVIYMFDGDIVRHHPEDYRSKDDAQADSTDG